MRVMRNAAARTCAVCERSLLMGEHAVRFSPDGGHGETKRRVLTRLGAFFERFFSLSAER